MSCCHQRYVVVDVTGCRPRNQCNLRAQICPDGSFPEHPLLRLFLADPRFSLFSGYGETDGGKSSLSYLLWVYEREYIEEYGELTAREMLMYHVAHLLYNAVVNAATEAQARQVQAAKGGNPTRIVTEIMAEGSGSISAATGDLNGTPYGRTLVGMLERNNIGFLAL